MTIWIVLGGGIGIGGLWWIRRCRDRRHLSTAWLVDDDRRRWTQGIDSVNWTWPVKKDDAA